MADGAKGVMGAIGESIVKPVKDEVGRAIEEGAQAIQGYPSKSQNQNKMDPNVNSNWRQEEVKIKKDDEIKKRRVMDFINTFKADYSSHQQKRRQEEQLKLQRQQQETQEKEAKKQEQIQKKQVQNQAVVAAQTRSETKAGKGVGG